MTHINADIKALNSIKDVLEPLKDALDDDGLESYADELYIAIEKIEALTQTLRNRTINQ